MTPIKLMITAYTAAGLAVMAFPGAGFGVPGPGGSFIPLFLVALSGSGLAALASCGARDLVEYQATGAVMVTVLTVVNAGWAWALGALVAYFVHLVVITLWAAAYARQTDYWWRS
jgi:hypothetical protein